MFSEEGGPQPRRLKGGHSFLQPLSAMAKTGAIHHLGFRWAHSSLLGRDFQTLLRSWLVAFNLRGRDGAFSFHHGIHYFSLKYSADLFFFFFNKLHSKNRNAANPPSTPVEEVGGNQSLRQCVYRVCSFQKLMVNPGGSEGGRKHQLSFLFCLKGGETCKGVELGTREKTSPSAVVDPAWGSQSGQLGSELAVRPWVSHFPSLDLSF